MQILSNKNVIPFVCLFFLLGGCSKTTFEWNSERTVGLLGVINDSLALYSSSRCWNKNVDDPWALGGNSEYSDGCTNMGLHVANYRSKQVPIWGDSVDFEIQFGSQVSDSVMQITSNGKSGFWKIGSKPTSLKKWAWTFASCTVPLDGEKRIRPWKKGSFIVIGQTVPKGIDSCQFAVLDSSSGTILQQRFVGEDLWLSECEDISFFNGNPVCLKARYNSNQYGIDLLVSGTIRDSMMWDSASWIIKKDISNWQGHQFWINHPTSKNDGKQNERVGKLIYELDSISYSMHPIEPGALIDYEGQIQTNDGAEVLYKGADLFVVTGTRK